MLNVKSLGYLGRNEVESGLLYEDRTQIVLNLLICDCSRSYFIQIKEQRILLTCATISKLPSSINTIGVSDRDSDPGISDG